jgi:ORF6N domain
MATSQVSPTAIESRIHLLRGHRVMLDVDLARLYGVEVKALNQAVKRNAGRFPADFMMLLEWEEVESLRSQIVTLNATPSPRGRHAKYRPDAFTEQGVAMLSSVLKSARAIQVNVEIMRAFVWRRPSRRGAESALSRETERLAQRRHSRQPRNNGK